MESATLKELPLRSQRTMNGCNPIPTVYNKHLNIQLEYPPLINYYWVNCATDMV